MFNFTLQNQNAMLHKRYNYKRPLLLIVLFLVIFFKTTTTSQNNFNRNIDRDSASLTLALKMLASAY